MDNSSKNASKTEESSSNYSFESSDISQSHTSSSSNKKRQSYEEGGEDSEVDRLGRTRKLCILSIARPHMRAFQFAWMASFICNFAWFSISPFIKNIRDEDNSSWLTGKNFSIQNSLSVVGPIFSRIAFGPIVDRFGPRTALCALMLLFSLTVFLIGTSQTFWQWSVARFFIGFLAAEQNITQAWTTNMFSSNVIGTVNSTTMRLGGMGAAVCAILMPQIFNLIVRAGVSDDKAWRIAMIFPGTVLILLSLFVYLFSDDYPIDDNVSRDEDLKMRSSKRIVLSICKLTFNWRIWILFIQNALSFGVALVFLGNLSTYFQDVFGVTQGNAGLMVGMFILPMLLACPVGGYLSDNIAKRFGLRGRVALMFLSLSGEGIALLGFSRSHLLSIAIPIMLLLSFMIFITAGTVFSIVPFVDSRHVGSVGGIVSVGSSVGGALMGSIIFRNGKEGVRKGFMVCGIAIAAEAIIVGAINVMVGKWNDARSVTESASENETHNGV